EKATHWVAFLRLGETNLLLMLALKPLNVLTSQLLSSFNDSLNLFDVIPLRRAISHEYNYR
ncbi:hypothetical protein ACUBYX_003311, partial [Providencia rettgeri]